MGEPWKQKTHVSVIPLRSSPTLLSLKRRPSRNTFTLRRAWSTSLASSASVHHAQVSVSRLSTREEASLRRCVSYHLRDHTQQNGVEGELEPGLSSLKRTGCA